MWNVWAGNVKYVLYTEVVPIIILHEPVLKISGIF